MQGLKESLPKSVRDQLQIKVVSDIDTNKLVEKARSLIVILGLFLIAIWYLILIR